MKIHENSRLALAYKLSPVGIVLGIILLFILQPLGVILLGLSIGYAGSFYHITVAERKGYHWGVGLGLFGLCAIFLPLGLYVRKRLPARTTQEATPNMAKYNNA